MSRKRIPIGNYRNELVPSRNRRPTRVRKLWNSILRLLRRIYWQSKESSLRGNVYVFLLCHLRSSSSSSSLQTALAASTNLRNSFARSAQILQVRYRNVRKFKSSLSFPVTDKIDAATTTPTDIAATAGVASTAAAGADGPISVP
ncbi:LOW QUALITY PROTEIN: hypothetical protein V1478_001865 [Vespula squamosa]|uniref:Uncharacterized protein n=1 Tax=Vespula squamosa TaxID=30214 RepID=A0ABD2BYF6_VESSQ